nr:p29 [Lingue ampelovirus 1]
MAELKIFERLSEEFFALTDSVVQARRSSDRESASTLLRGMYLSIVNEIVPVLEGIDDYNLELQWTEFAVQKVSRSGSSWVPLHLAEVVVSMSKSVTSTDLLFPFLVLKDYIFGFYSILKHDHDIAMWVQFYLRFGFNTGWQERGDFSDLFQEKITSRTGGCLRMTADLKMRIRLLERELFPGFDPDSRSVCDRYLGDPLRIRCFVRRVRRLFRADHFSNLRSWRYRTAVQSKYLLHLIDNEIVETDK